MLHPFYLHVKALECDEKAREHKRLLEQIRASDYAGSGKVGCSNDTITDVNVVFPQFTRTLVS